MHNDSYERNEPRLNLFQSLRFRYFPYWPVFVFFALIFLGTAWFYLKITPQKFKSTASILIKDEKKGVDNSQIIESFNIYASKKIVENEIEVIKSKTILNSAISKLNLYAPVYYKDFTFKSAFSSSPVIIEIKDLNIFPTSEPVPFFYDSVQKIVKVFHESYNINDWIKSPYGTIRFIKNPFLKIESDGTLFFSVVDPKRILEKLQSNILVSPVSKLSTVVSISMLDEDSIRGESIINTLIDSYILAAVEEKQSLAENTMDFVEDRILKVERQLDSVESIIQHYKSNKGIVNLSEQGKLYLQNVGENDQKTAELNMQLAVLSKVEEYVIAKDNRAGLVPATLGLNDPGLTQLIQKLYDSEIKYERLRKTTPENNLIMVTLKKEIDQIRPGILENISNQRQSIEAGLKTLGSAAKSYTNVLQTIPVKERELLEINRQQAIKNNVYTFLLQKREETALSYASTVGDNRIIDRASTSSQAQSPKKLLVFSIAIFGAFLCGIIWVSFKELFSSKILFRSEIEENTIIPIASEISHTGIKNPVVIDNDKKPFLTEQFRQLRAAVGFYGKTPKKILMITSNISGEGKSFISLNFAISLARSNKKVLLVDFDLRNPNLSNVFNSIGKAGIGELLKETYELESLVQETEHYNLYFISAGMDLKNPTETLMNANFESLFLRFKENFDFIIVDTPPIDPVTDAFLIAPYCEKTLFVLRHNKTPKSMLKFFMDQNNTQVFNNLSLVFNGVRTRGFLKRKYGYGYGYKATFIN